MRVFVAGSTGVLGRSVVRQLCARGYEVVGLVRSQEKARLVQELGAEPVVGDILDVGSLRRAVAWSDAIMHLATAIPKKARPWGSDWAMNDRVRCEGTRNLIEAAQGNRIQAFVLQSVAFMYGDRRGQWIGEEETPRPGPRVRSALEAEKLALKAQEELGLPVVILRGARFYSADAWHTRSMIKSLKWRLYPIVGDGEQYWHFIHVDDMARACVAAVEETAPGETFFVADDWPFHAKDLLNYLAAQLHADAPARIPPALANLLTYGAAGSLAHSVRYRNNKIKNLLGWSPQYPTYRDGFAEILSGMGVTLR